MIEVGAFKSFLLVAVTLGWFTVLEFCKLYW